MKVKIEIVSKEVKKFSGISKAGNDYSLVKQEAYLHNGHAYPQLFEFTLPKDLTGNTQSPYEPGFYTLADDVFVIDREFGALRIDSFNFRLVKLPDESAKPAVSKAA